MSSASSLVSDLIGDDSDYTDEEYDDYFDADCAEYYSPYQELPICEMTLGEPETIVEGMVPAPVKKEKKIIKKISCELCGVEIQENFFESHLNSKKHRNQAMERKIAANKAAYQLAERKKHQTFRELWKEISTTPAVLEHILSYIQPSELLKMRLVARDWDNYLRLPSFIQGLYTNITGDESEISSLYNNSYAFLRLPTHYSFDSNYGIERFLHTFTSKSLCNALSFRIPLSDCIHIHYYSLLQQICEVLEKVNVPEITLAFRGHFERHRSIKTPSQLITSMFSALSKNKWIDTLRATINTGSLSINPLRLLATSCSINKLVLSSLWFKHLSRVKTNDPVQKEALKQKQTFVFDNRCVTDLCISSTVGYISRQNSTIPVRAVVLLLRSIHENIKLEKLELSCILTDSCTESEEAKISKALAPLIGRDSRLKELNASRSEFGALDISPLAANKSLERLNLSHHSFGTSEVDINTDISENTTLQSLNLSHTGIKMTPSFLKRLPQGLAVLDVSSNGQVKSKAITIEMMDAFPVHLPQLFTLHIQNNIFVSHDCLRFISQSPNLRELKIFQNTRFRGEFSGLAKQAELFEQSNLVSCDHHFNFSEKHYFHMIDEILERNSQSRGRRTKGVRRR